MAHASRLGQFVFRMSDPVFPGEMVPDFICKGLMGDTEKLVARGDYEGAYVVIILYPKDFTDVGEDTLNLMADLAANKEFNLEPVGDLH